MLKGLYCAHRGYHTYKKGTKMICLGDEYICSFCKCEGTLEEYNQG